MKYLKRIILCSIACSLLLLCFIFSRNPEKPSDKSIVNEHQHEQTQAKHPIKSQTPPKADHKPHGENVSILSKSTFWSVSVSNKNQTKIRNSPVEQKPRQLSPTSKPKDPPYIGDTYMSEDIQPQTHCPDGIRSQITNSDFGPLFLKNIPVLLMAKHITLEHHRRLSLYTPVHGWKDVNYSTLLEAQIVFSSPATWQMFDDWKDRKTKSECITCAVVGNGGILKNSRKGKEIDSHHYVFRTNGAIIKGFEQDVGTRTTHYTFTTNTLMNSLKSYKTFGFTGPPQSQETRYLFLPSDKRDYRLVTAAVTHTQVDRGQDQGQDPSKYFGKNVTAEKFKMLHPDFMRFIRNRFLRSEYLKGNNVYHFRPTTGAAMLLAALHTCDKVSAYGFMTPDYRKYTLYYFYRSYRPLQSGINHDWKMELNLWQKLHRAGLIRLYMRNQVS